MRDSGRSAFWFLLIAGLGAFALAMAYRWFERGGAFDLDTVRVRGIRKADSSFVCQAIRPLFGQSIWQIDLGGVRETLSDLPGIESVSVKREPLSTLVLNIEISQPAFAVSCSSSVTAVSSMGERLPSRFLSDSLPVINSVEQISSNVSMRIAEWLRVEELGSGDMVFLYDSKGLSVFDGSGRQILLGRDDLSSRWESYLAISSSLPGCSEWEQVDMRYSNQAVLRGVAEAGQGVSNEP